MLSFYFVVFVVFLIVFRGVGGIWGFGRFFDVGWFFFFIRIFLIIFRILKNKCIFYLFIYEYKFENGNIVTV